jgi:asparagine synthase (glutamine-hydrolysing)
MAGNCPFSPVTLNSLLFAIQESDSINAMSLCELQGYMANTLLRDTDQMSMAHGLEVRVPFVDKTVVNSVVHLPGEWKIHDQRPKPLLLDAMTGLLPEEIWRRPKMGFTLPFERWMHSVLEAQLQETLNVGNGLDLLGVSQEAAREIWQMFSEHPTKERWSRPWALYVLKRWCDLNDVRA